MKRLLLPSAGFAFLVLCAASQSAEFTFPDHTITVPDGFMIERVADAPLVLRPISGAFDEQGRLYVTDSGGMTDKADKQLETKPHRIVRLEDTDGDGRFDRSVVFADRMMFPEGCMWFDGSLYVAAPPQIWKLTDTNGDGVADQREVWFDGKTLTGCANDLHGPFLGRDGWFYWCKGAFAEQRHTLANGKPFVTRASHIFRARPDGSGIEPVLTGGMDNPVGVAITSTGERFLSCTFFQQPGDGKRDGLIHAIYGGVYGKVHDPIFSHPMTGQLMPVLTHMGAAAPCGITCYQSRVFGDDFRDNLFACYFNLHKVGRHVLVPEGATFRTEDSDFVVSDNPDFHPTDVIEDADGSLLIVDTGGWYKICCPTSQLAKPDILGAIYRVRKKDAPKIADPRGLNLDWASMKPAQLAELLGDRRIAVQTRAIQQLERKGTAAVPALREVLKKSDSADARRNAVWALTRIDGVPARELVRLALADGDPGVKHAAMHSVSVRRDPTAAAQLVAILQRGAPQLQRAAAEALGRIGDKTVVPALLAVSGASHDRVLEHSLTYALFEIGERESTAKGLASKEPHTRRAALIALDQMENGGLKPEQVTPLLQSNDAVLKETASWIVGHRPEWGDVLSAFFRERLVAKSLTDKERTELEGQLRQLAKSTAIQDLLAQTIRAADSPGARLSALRAMASTDVKEAPVAWLDALAALLPNADADTLPQAVATARALPLPKKGHPALAAALLAVGRKTGTPAEVRLDALSAAGSVPSVEPALFDFLVANVAPSKPLLVRGNAAGVLAKAKLTSAQQLALAEAVKGVGPLELAKLLPAFEHGASQTLGARLLASLKESAGFRGLRVDQLKPVLAKYPAPIQDAGGELLTLLNADIATQAAQLNQMIAELSGGEVRRGQAAFLKAGCSACHAMGHLGGRLGPDLTRIGKVRTERDLLESIVYPSASFVRSYEPMTVVTKSGDAYDGVLRKDAPDEVVLATGPETEQRIGRTNVTEMRPGAVSIMPQGFDQALTRQELADLVTFLKAAQ